MIRLLVGLDVAPNDQSYQGDIYVNTQSVSSIDRTKLFSYVGQNTDLFGGLNVLENIEYGIITAENYNNSIGFPLLNALSDSQVNEIVERLPNNLHSSVGSRGRLLSGGERQRICIARALLREELLSNILLLDEATSSLDVHTEAAFIHAINKRVIEKKSTVIMIAHRLKSLENCNSIIVLQNGEITEQGTHHELIKSNGWYSKAWKLQQHSSK